MSDTPSKDDGAKPAAFTFGAPSGSSGSSAPGGAFTFSGGGIASAVAEANARPEGASEDPVDATEDGEHTGAQFEPVVKLTEFVKVETEEPEEDELLNVRCKLYRYNNEDAEWKERGLGDLRILKNTQRGSIRVLMRRDKTHKVCANHYIVPGMELSENVGSDKSWVYSATDFSDGDAHAEVLAAKFPNKDVAQEFKVAFEKAREEMTEVQKKVEAEGGDADKAEEAEEAKAE